MRPISIPTLTMNIRGISYEEAIAVRPERNELFLINGRRRHIPTSVAQIEDVVAY